MKQKQFIIIRKRKYQQIRDNLRKIISMSVSSKSQVTQHRLSDEYYILQEALKKSIVKCSICETLHDDRVYNAYAKEWICPNCYIVLEDLYKEVTAKKKRGEHIGDYEQHLEYYSSFFRE